MTGPAAPGDPAQPAATARTRRRLFWGLALVLIVAAAAVTVILVRATPPVSGQPSGGPAASAAPHGSSTAMAVPPDTATASGTALPKIVAAGDALYASPAGTGKACSATSPCLLAAAVTGLKDETGHRQILLNSGDYGALRLLPPAKSSLPSLEIAPAPGATVHIASLQSYLAHTTWRNLTISGVLYLRPAAVGSELDHVTVDGAGLFLRSDDTYVHDSTFENGASTDGIQIGGAHGVRIERVLIHDYNQEGSGGYHSDCIQMFDSSDIVIQQSRMSNCYDDGIIFSGGAGKGLQNVLIESNFIQGCIQRDKACKGGAAMDIREASATGVIVRNNTILTGSVRIGTQPGLVFDRNIVGYLANCDAHVTNSLVAKWNTGLCHTLDTVGTQTGTRIATVAVVDETAGDLDPKDPSQVRIQPVGSATPASQTLDGAPMPADVVGAMP